MNDAYKKHLFRDPKEIINKTIYIFLFSLFKYIIIKKKDSNPLQKKLNAFVNKINTEIIKNEKHFITLEYSINNFKNILLFVKKQNQLFSGDIIEGILIYTFSYAFSANKDDTFAKYIYANLFKIKEANNYDIVEMFKERSFKPPELNNLKKLLLIDASIEEAFNQRISEDQDKCILYNLLYLIFLEKLVIIKNQKNKKSMFYINKGNFENNKESKKMYLSIKDNSTTILDRDTMSNSIMTFVDFSIEGGIVPIRLIRSFFIQVYIYYQNKNSPLMEYIYEKKNCEIVPFVYDLRGAYVEGRYAYIILSPARIEPRISRIYLSSNNLRENGVYEMGKVVLFNKEIKIIDYNFSLIRPNFIEYFNSALGLFDNHSLESLNLSSNYLKENTEDFITKLLCHFKGLKALILSNNDFKKGLSSFFIVLKKLYRKKVISLENLVLNKCLLDDSSFYELGELLKCKYCKLKKLYLSGDALPYNSNFLTKLKKNKSLTEIHLNKTEIWNNKIDDILRIISNTMIRHLYLFKNKIINMSDLLRIINRTKIIKDENNIMNDKINENYFLINLDLSNNDIYNKNTNYITLLSRIIDETCLYCLDISHIIFGLNPDKREINNQNIRYRKKVDEFQRKLEKNKNDYLFAIKEKQKNEVDIKNNKKLEEEKILTDLDDIIYKVINEKNAKFPVYLKDSAKHLIQDKKLIEDKKEFKDMQNKLVNYMILKRSEKTYNEMEEKINKNKLIII
jgi:hypothetical protein